MTSNHVEIHMQGALEPLIVDEPMQATAMNMSAAMKNSMLFFQATTTDGKTVYVSIPNVLYIIESDEV